MKKHIVITDRTKKMLSAIALVVFFAVFTALAILIGPPLVRFVSNPEGFRDWVDAQGAWGPLLFIGLMALQILVAIIPGEPLEIAAGYAFGAVWGTVYCMIGALVGSVLVFLFVRKFGVKLVEVFFTVEKIRGMKFLQDTKRLNVVVFIIYLIPGTPKDLLAYLIGLTPMRLSVWVMITLIARIPSIVTSTVGGHALGMQNYTFAAVTFAVTGVLSLVGYLLYRKLSSQNND